MMQAHAPAAMRKPAGYFHRNSFLSQLMSVLLAWTMVMSSLPVYATDLPRSEWVHSWDVDATKPVMELAQHRPAPSMITRRAIAKTIAASRHAANPTIAALHAPVLSGTQGSDLFLNAFGGGLFALLLQAQDSPLDVSVGFADNTSPSANFPEPWKPAEAANPDVHKALTDFTAFRRSLFSEPAQDPAWQSQHLDYQFALGSPATNDNVLLTADDFPGGHLDWYSFNLASAQANAAATANPATVTPTTFNFLPNHVVFRGMPDSRWWNFEDAVTNFGQLDADHVDLAKLLVMEFALVYGNDWFSVPVPTPVGSLERVTTLVVTDTFGIRTLIRPSEQTQVNPGETPWSMFKLSGQGARSDFIAMAPTLGVVDDADALEEVLFLRDDMAAIAWAVEHQLQGDLDAPLDAYELYLQRTAGWSRSADQETGHLAGLVSEFGRLGLSWAFHRLLRKSIYGWARSGFQCFHRGYVRTWPSMPESVIDVWLGGNSGGSSSEFVSEIFSRKRPTWTSRGIGRSD